MPVRRGSFLMVLAIGLVVGAVATAVAIFVPWLPEQASEEGERIDFVFWFVTAICIAIFALVASVSIYSFVKFRVRPDDDSDGPPIHGHTGLEIAWTVVPAILVTAIGIVSAVALAQNDSLPDDHMTVEVRARQFAWSFSYPERKPSAEGEARNALQCARPGVEGDPCLTSATLRLPLGVPVELRMMADDVIHALWVPQFRQKQDLLPGEVTRLVITPTKVGTFPLVCAELCGLGHAAMRSMAIVMPRAEFDSWKQRTSQALGGAPGEAGKSVFAENGCGSCHVFAPAGATGAVGPSLDELPAQARRAGRELEAFVRESIVKPDAYVEQGYAPNLMPETFDGLPAGQLDALVQYLVKPGKKGAQ